MSFGFGVGDFLAVGQLCWKVYKKCKDSSGNYAELSTEVGALHNVIKETEELLSQQGLTSEQGGKLTTCRQGCDDVLRDLDELLNKYESLGTNSRRTFDRMRFGMEDMNGIRLRLNLNVSMLDAFNNASSHARLEKKLNLLIAEVRAGKREGSVISTRTIDSVARNNQETWETLRRELEDVGISPAIITEKRQFIVAWFQEAVAAGEFEEDAPSDDDSSIMPLYESTSRYESDVPAGEFDDGLVPNRDVSSMMIEPRTTRLSPKPNHKSLPSRKKKRSRTSVTYLFNVLRRRDKQLFEAAERGDLSMVRNLLEKGADVESKSSPNGDTALVSAAMSGHVSVIQLLLEKGADVESKSSPNGDTALIFAAMYGHLSTVQLLLEKGADIESESSSSGTALMCAAKRRREAIVQLLLDKGARVNTRDIDGKTALDRAGTPKIAQLLRDAAVICE